VTRDLVRSAIAVADEDPVLKQLLERIAEDEDRHTAFFDKVVRRGIEVAPDQIVLAIAAHLHDEANVILGGDIDDYEHQLEVIAKAGIHSEATQRAYVVAALREWGILDIEDGLSEPARKAAHELREYTARK
jgi:acyl-[acyl-carrier-protein] desaturase